MADKKQTMLYGLLTSIASKITYDNTESGLTADNVQDAIDEVSSASSSFKDSFMKLLTTLEENYSYPAAATIYDRFTWTVPKDGIYYIDYTPIGPLAQTTMAVYAGLKVNGIMVAQRMCMGLPNGSGFCTLSTFFEFEAGDVLTFTSWVSSGATTTSTADRKHTAYIYSAKVD